jgi:hypothetical protein
MEPLLKRLLGICFLTIVTTVCGFDSSQRDLGDGVGWALYNHSRHAKFHIPSDIKSLDLFDDKEEE